MRKNKIIDFINRKNEAKVSELVDLFCVSEKTIRRDLVELEEQGKLVRVRGGAASLKQADIGTSFSSRSKRNIDRKSWIVEQAVEMISEGSAIGLDASTSCWLLAQHLPDLKITVVTNSLRIVKALESKHNINVFCLSGYYSPRYEAFYGLSTNNQLKRLSLDISFLSCHGFFIDGDVWDTNEINAELKINYLNISKKNVLIVDSSKFEKKSLVSFCKINEFDTVITNDNIKSAFYNNINLVTPD